MADIELLPLARMNWPYSVISATLATPPGSPTAGDPYIIAASPTGAWSGHANAIARWSGSVWEFQTPGLGRSVYVEATGVALRWNGTAWINPTTSIGSPSLSTPPSLLGLAAGALDDEFESTTIGGTWVFRDTTTGPTNRTPSFGALTESTNITGATTVPKVSLHTQGRRSWMFVQTTITGPATYLVYKPFTWAANQFYWCRLGHIFRLTGTTPTVNPAQFTLWADSAGVPDNNNRVSVYYDLVNSTVRWQSVTAGSSSNVTFNISDGWGAMPFLGIGNPAGVLGGSANWYGEMFTDDGLRVLPAGVGAASNSFTPAYIGWSTAQTYARPDALAVDFVRETTGHPLLHVG